MAPDAQQLLNQLQHPSGETSWAAARELARRGERQAIEPLLEMLTGCLAANQQDPSATAENRRCWGVASALATFREPRAFGGLLRLVRESRGGTQQYAARALGAFGDTADPDFWSADAFRRKLAVAPPGLIGVGTARYDDVPVVVEVVSQPPVDEPQGWDQVVEASLELPSGKLAIDGCLSYEPTTSPHIELAPGTYRVRVYYAGQNTVDEDWYRVVLWPQSPYEPPRILRQQESSPLTHPG